MAALIGYNVQLAVSNNNWTPTVTKSVAGNVTAASGGTALTLPWVDNLNAYNGTTITTNTSSPLFYSAVMAAFRAMLDDRSLNGNPT